MGIINSSKKLLILVQKNDLIFKRVPELRNLCLREFERLLKINWSFLIWLTEVKENLLSRNLRRQEKIWNKLWMLKDDIENVMDYLQLGVLMMNLVLLLLLVWKFELLKIITKLILQNLEIFVFVKIKQLDKQNHCLKVNLFILI